jgi:hypothetical protein
MTNTTTRVVNTKNLKRLIENAEVLDLNQYPDIKRLTLDPAGFHVLELVLMDHKGFTNRDIVHHRVKVMAKVWQRQDEPLTPAEFLLDIRAEDWDLLLDAESMNRALEEIKGQLEGVKHQGIGRRTRMLYS